MTAETLTVLTNAWLLAALVMVTLCYFGLLRLVTKLLQTNRKWQAIAKAEHEQAVQLHAAATFWQQKCRELQPGAFPDEPPTLQ